MITMEQFLENNSEEEKICIAVYGQEQYSELMTILDNNGYKWNKYGHSETSLSKSRIVSKEHRDSFIALIYLSAEKTVAYILFQLDEELNEIDVDFVFYDDWDSAEYLIKPFPYLKREMKRLGLC